MSGKSVYFVYSPVESADLLDVAEQTVHVRVRDRQRRLTDQMMEVTLKETRRRIIEGIYV